MNADKDVDELRTTCISNHLGEMIPKFSFQSAFMLRLSAVNMY